MIDHNQASDLIRTEVARIVTEGGLVNPDQGETLQRSTIKALQWAWCQAVRAEWQAFVDADPELKAQHAIALELMREDGYTMEQEPICGLPGAKPMVAIVDGKESVCLDYSMAQVTPLSAIYTNKVRAVQSAAARVAKTLAEEAVKQPAEWPITIASGAVFNSIEDMKASPNEFVRGLAESMEKAQEEREKAAANAFAGPIPVIDTPNVRWFKPEDVKAEQTCWQYFGFDGPVSLDRLQMAYLGKVECESTPTVANAKLAGEAHQQYQNCLKDLASMSAGPAVTIGDDDVD